MTQIEFLQSAMVELGMTRDAFAVRLGWARRTLDNGCFLNHPMIIAQCLKQYGTWCGKFWRTKSSRRRLKK